MGKNSLLFLICLNNQVGVIAEELRERFRDENSGTVLEYGFTERTGQGYILSRWTTPIPANLIAAMRVDEDIVDFVICDVSQQSTT